MEELFLKNFRFITNILPAELNKKGSFFSLNISHPKNAGVLF